MSANHSEEIHVLYGIKTQLYLCLRHMILLISLFMVFEHVIFSIYMISIIYMAYRAIYVSVDDIAI